MRRARDALATGSRNAIDQSKAGAETRLCQTGSRARPIRQSTRTIRPGPKAGSLRPLLGRTIRLSEAVFMCHDDYGSVDLFQ